mgnify:CR=1 FL=1
MGRVSMKRGLKVGTEPVQIAAFNPVSMKRGLKVKKH